MGVLISIMSNWRENLFILIGVFCVFLLFLIGIKNHQIINLKLQYQTVQSQLIFQNQMAEQWKLESDLQAKKVQDSQKKSEKINSDFDKKYDELKKEKVPEKCEDAAKWAIHHAQKLNQDWENRDWEDED